MFRRDSWFQNHLFEYGMGITKKICCVLISLACCDWFWEEESVCMRCLLHSSEICQILEDICCNVWLNPNWTYAGFRLACRLPLCRYAAWSSLAVSELQLSAAMPLWLYHRAASLPSCIEFNCLRSAAVGKAARLSIYWLDAACRLVIPLRQVALAQLDKYHHQSGNAAS